MTPKEKALELIEKYQFIYIQNYTSMHEVTECALSTVDEILSATNEMVHENTGYYTDEYWHEVKSETEKI
jgi:diphthamide biosynthesis methyltransferase